MYDLVIVESPAKAKTIEGYLGKKYKVTSSVGHIRDLAKSGPGGLGLDIDNDFEPNYTYIKGKKKVVNDIKKLAKDADKIYIATDPDREGEAIGWHIADELLLDLDDENRITFSEITKDGVKNGINNVHKLDMNLVRSQETRRKLDRIIGFKLSKLLQKKIKAKSAGRVQSVALQMIVYREREIRDFVPVEYFKIAAIKDDHEIEWVKNSKKLPKDEVEVHFNELNKSKELICTDIKEKNKSQKAKMAYITSTFQQDAVNKLNMSARRAMSTAQKLYEGINIGSNSEGLITYMRTDSTRLESKFVASTKNFIENEFGTDYVGSYKSFNSKNSQDAHEAIRPTNVYNTPDKIKKFLTDDQYKIYNMIWKRTVASIMANAKLKTLTYILMGEGNNEFRFSNTQTIFEGYRKLYNDSDEETSDLKFKVGEKISIDEFKMTQHYTQPKPRYTEARLIKELEENGVGRPSTYASIIDTLKKRNYVTVDNKKFIPTEDGELVTKTLDDFFNDVINAKYTSEMEKDLDLIAIDEKDELVLLKDFYSKFENLIENAEENLEQLEAEKTGNICPECGSDLVWRKGRYGKFEACSNFPKCRYITKQEVDVLCKCPQCEDGDIIEKKTRKGKEFYACTNYPKCDFATWNLSDLEKEIKEYKEKIKNDK